MTTMLRSVVFAALLITVTAVSSGCTSTQPAREAETDEPETTETLPATAGGETTAARGAASEDDATTPGNYVRHRVDGALLTVEGERATLRVSFYRPEMARVDWLPEGTERPDTSFAVIQTAGLQPTVRETETKLFARTPKMTVTVHKSPLRVTLAGPNGRVLLEERPKPLLVTDSTRTVQFAADSTMHVYGTGERGGSFNLQGRAFDVYNTPRYGYDTAPATMKINIPFAVTTGGFGLFMDEIDRGRLDIGATEAGRLAYTSEYGAVSYVVIAASDIREQIRHYTWLTGRQPLPPKWSLGYIQSKYGYRNEAEARGVIDTLRARDFPVDALVLDLYWFEHMGDLAWNRERFPAPFDMMADLSERGVQTVAITETYLAEPSDLYDEAGANGHVGTNADGSPMALPDWWSCPDGCPAYLVDLTRPQTRDWWWSEHLDFMGDQSGESGRVAGFWTDLGEPEKHPDSMQHHMGAAPEIHNAYNLLWAKTLYDGLRDIRPRDRVYNLTRSGSAGIQRFGTVHWSGDVRRSFVGLAEQPKLMLQAGLSGLAYYGSDIGGFLGDTISPELMIRWMQHGALTPTMRPHGVDNLPTEPWRFGAEAERIIRDYIKLRYRLMPYLYTLAYENHTTGMPIARPLFFADPTDTALHEESNAYLFGDALLVAPVLTRGAREVDVTLPEGAWLNIHTETIVSGGQTITVDAPLGDIPIFQKAGTVVPMRPSAPHTAAQPRDSLELHVVPGAEEASFTLYEDDGETIAYTEGAYTLTPITQSRSGDTMTLEIGAASGSYDGMPTERTIGATIHRIERAPTGVRLGNEALVERERVADVKQMGGYVYDPDAGTLTVQARLDVTDTHRFTITTGEE
jgi:alpha-glucosidase (family GH31 glycosyl hydrolase)